MSWYSSGHYSTAHINPSFMHACMHSFLFVRLCVRSSLFLGSGTYNHIGLYNCHLSARPSGCATLSSGQACYLSRSPAQCPVQQALSQHPGSHRHPHTVGRGGPMLDVDDGHAPVHYTSQQHLQGVLMVPLQDRLLHGSQAGVIVWGTAAVGYAGQLAGAAHGRGAATCKPRITELCVLNKVIVQYPPKASGRQQKLPDNSKSLRMQC